MGAGHCFIIAEIGVNHNGDLDLARRLIDVAADAGADAAKFQTFRADQLIVEGTEAVEYQKKDNADLKQYDLLKNLELSDEAHHALVEHCKMRGIEFMSTGFDELSLQFLIDLGIRRIKIPSGEITNTPLLEMAAAAQLPIIVSTGMATLEEVRTAVETVRAIWKTRDHAGDLIVLHCTSAYPTPLSDVNLSAMATLASELGEAVGYSDHTEGTAVSALAVAAGARMIEKHITLDKTMDGPDHAASLEPSDLVRMVQEIRQVEAILGDGVKAPMASEIEARAWSERGSSLRKHCQRGMCFAGKTWSRCGRRRALLPSESRICWVRRLVEMSQLISRSPPNILSRKFDLSLLSLAAAGDYGYSGPNCPKLEETNELYTFRPA